jgi:hypothetical protein
MHGTFERSRKSNDRIERGRDIGFLVVPAVLAIVTIGLAIIQPATPSLIADAVQAEFVGFDLAPELTPTQFAQPAMFNKAAGIY